MIGFYNYTVILTYVSVCSAGFGIFISLGGGGHPYIGMFFLMLCGFCDAFDGMVAKTKKDRTEREKKFGIQIDSLTDVLAFGVLPACIVAAQLRQSVWFERSIMIFKTGAGMWSFRIFIYLILVIYVLAAVIRLAFFNVDEEERQNREEGGRKYYLGLPVTTSALIIPASMVIQYVTRSDFTFLSVAVLLITAVLFVTPFKLKKFGLKGLITLVVIGAAIFALFLCAKFIWL